MSSAIKKRQAKLIFEKWRGLLSQIDRGKDRLIDNFDNLFYEMMCTGIDFDTAHEYLDLAIAAHSPSRETVKWTYKKTGGLGARSESEFEQKWLQLIRDAATNVFYTRFPIENAVEKEETQLPNGMSKEEYIRQRRYASSFPALDLSLLPDVDVEHDDVDLEAEVLGGTDG